MVVIFTAVRICGVEKGSFAAKKRIKSGDTLLSINGNEINDVLDYRFYAQEEKLILCVLNKRGRTRKIKIKKSMSDEIGLEFETYLMDKKRSCRNKCMFCFIDQMPKGMRESLYFKDDDSRLSFLFGNYITLTNITEHDVERIIKMHISPVNISVHTMNPKLRVEMMKNPHAGEVLSFIGRLAEAGIKINAQLVLCPGINDGEELEFSLKALSEMYPSVQSIAAVPVGLTKFREGLCKIEPYCAETAGETLDIIEKFADDFMKQHGTRLAFAADEFYLKAGREIPDSEFYEDFAQLENGVGMWAYLRDSFLEELSSFENITLNEHITMATGEAAFPLISHLARLACDKFSGLKIEIVKIHNDFFGRSINVAGLITGKDLTEQLKGRDLGTRVIIPSSMLSAENDVFLDDLSLDEAQNILGVPIIPVNNDGTELLSAMLGEAY